jgi:hypothetical protein
MAARYTPKFRFVLADKQTGRFPKIDTGLISEKQLTDSLEYTYVFDDRDNPELKKGYYNAVYKGVAEFEPFVF